MSRPDTAGKETVVGADPDADGEQLRKKEEQQAGDDEDPRAPSIVEGDAWDSDPANPRTWPNSKKWLMVAVVAWYTLVAPLASSMLAPGLPQLADHYNITNPTVIALVLTIFLLGFAIGPLLFGPLSEMYGRTWILHTSTFLFFVFNLVSVWAPNVASVVVFRFLAGLGGSAAVSIGGGSISDLFHERERAWAMAIYTSGPLLGPVIGPVCGGFIVASIGFKYVFVLVSALAGIGLVFGVPILRETYAPVIMERMVRRRAQDELERGLTQEKVPERPPFWRHLYLNLSRPFILLMRSSICFLLSLYMALIYGYLYLMFTTFPDVFSTDYGWSTAISGLAYLGIGTGFMIATIGSGRVGNWIYSELTRRNNGVAKPEFRIPPMIIGSVFVPIGLFWYGWSAAAKIHWIMPIIGTAWFGIGLMTVYLPILLYLVDSFTYAASAVAAASVLRSLFGFFFPLFGEQMFATLGIGGGNSLLAGLAILLGCPFPVFLYFYGDRLRAKSKWNK